jgi:hypothetical protein
MADTRRDIWFAVGEDAHGNTHIVVVAFLGIVISKNLWHMNMHLPSIMS